MAAVLAVKAFDQQQYINFEKANVLEMMLLSARAGAVRWQK